VGCKRTLLLDGYNITCKALEISAIIKGSRGKRKFNSTPRAILRVEERAMSPGGAKSLKEYFATGCVG
jgi:hypothetical protein